jgi:hypothetical protein
VREQRAAEERRGLRRVDAEAAIAQPSYAVAARARPSRVAFEQLDQPANTSASSSAA